ncbi:MAG: hypothetical protein AAGA48_33910 [Myxococcota bacterium]
MYGLVMAGAFFSSPAHAQADAEGASEPRVRLTARGGYTNYSRLHFVTGEAEVAFRVVSKLHVVAGAAVYGVQLTPPVQRQLETGKLKEWAALAPFHAGVRFQFPVLSNELYPFVGADLLTGRYYQSDDGGAWALGARLRGGVDWMFLDPLGLHANVGFGVWTGDRWGELATGLPTTGVLPQLSVGLTYAL